ncbi:MAG TPA: hypothetical protein VK464_27595, partial [Symbiobacteriaceae bacterium]|nr:hypothetical protein [Symbiobacteriaceae bacterium]
RRHTPQVVVVIGAAGGPVFEVAVLGSEVTAQYLIACMQLCRAAELSIYLHRYEMLMVVFFVFGVITQSVVCLYGACELGAAVLPGQLRRPWLHVGAGLLAMPIVYYLGYDRDRYAGFLSVVWPLVAIPIAFGLPLLLAAVALLRPGLTKTGAAAP